MKNRVTAILAGLVMTLTTTSVSYAMSELAAMSIEPLWPTNASPGNVVLYEITIERQGQGLLQVELSSLGLPEGATVDFSCNPVRFTGNKPDTATVLMVVTCAELTPTDIYPFTVTGAARRESITLTNQISVQLNSFPSAPVLITMDMQETGNIALYGLGLGGQTYQVEATEDLGNPSWTNIGTCTADGNGRFTFIEADAQTYPMRFYRVAWIASTE